MTVLDYTSSYDEKRELESNRGGWFTQTVLSCAFFRNAGVSCKYCGTEMDRPVDCRFNGPFPTTQVIRQVLSCPKCGWWHCFSGSNSYCGDGEWIVGSEWRFGVLRKFDTDSIETPLNSLRMVLNDRPTLLHEIHPKKLEQLVGSVFRDHLDCEVRHVGRTSDGGIDLILIDASEPQVVQVKRRANPKSREGVEALREFIGAMVLDERRKGIFVTTADRYTRGAKNAARQAQILGVVDQLDLIDVHRFIEMLRVTHTKVDLPWQIALRGSISDTEGQSKT